MVWNRIERYGIEWNVGNEYEYEQKSNLKLSMTYNQIGELRIAK